MSCINEEAKISLRKLDFRYTCRFDGMYTAGCTFCGACDLVFLFIFVSYYKGRAAFVCLLKIVAVVRAYTDCP